MRSPSFIARFSGFTTNDAPIPYEGGIIVVGLTAITGMPSAVLPADPDREVTFATTGVQGQNPMVVVTTAVAPTVLDSTVLDSNGAGPAAPRAIAASRNVAQTIGHVRRDRRSARDSMKVRRNRRMTLPVRRLPWSLNQKSPRRIQKNASLAKPYRRRNRPGAITSR
jgi:hypothetical protein